MDKAYFSPASPANAERLVEELKVMRDAVVRLSLALEDYVFLVRSNQSPDVAREVSDLLANIQSCYGKSPSLALGRPALSKRAASTNLERPQ